jgi:hypothetical protein
VTCTASDQANLPDVTSGSFQVVVNKGTPPTLQVSGTIMVKAIRKQGAVVNYMVSATSPTVLSTQLTITCKPPSGSIFPIGTTSVECKAVDPVGNASTASFQVVKALLHRDHRCDYDRDECHPHQGDHHRHNHTLQRKH